MKQIIKDQLNRSINLKQTPTRIISLVPSLTELLVDMGLEDSLLGITKFCVHPEHLRKEKTVVGGTKKVHLEKIRALKPDIIICNKEENTREMVLDLEKIATVHVSDVKNIGDSLDLIAQYGDIFGKEDRAQAISAEISKGLSDFKEFMEGKPPKRIGYIIWKNPWMVAGRETFIDHLLELNNFQNVFSTEGSRYPEIKLAAIKEKNVELILLSTEPYPFGEKHRKELKTHFSDRKIEIVDGEYFSWYGSRLVSAFSYFKSLQTQRCSF